MMERQNNQETEEYCYLPREIIFEILIRLPLKSVPRCKCVCKLWCEIANEHKFIMDHCRRSKKVYEYRDASTPDDEFKRLSVSYGMMVEKSKLTNKYRVRNLATHKVLDLDILRDHTLLIKHIILFYLPSTTSYKLVYVHGKKAGGMEYINNGGCQVQTVGTDRTWRTLDIPGLYDLGCERAWSYATGIDGVFFITRLFDDGYRTPEIVCIEMESEHFVNFTIPLALFSSWTNVKPLLWDKNLALANLVEQELHVWVLDDYKKQQWTERKIHLSFLNKYPKLNIKFSHLDVTHNLLSILQYYGDHLYYHIGSKTLKIINHLPQGKRLQGYFYKPSLVNLEKIHRKAEVNAEGICQRKESNQSNRE